MQKAFIKLHLQVAKETFEVILVRSDGMLGIPFLKFKVIQKNADILLWTQVHKKTDNQS